MSDDDDLFVHGREPGAREVPGSRRRRAYYEDDGVLAVGQDRLRPAKKRARRPSGLWEYWLHVMEPVLFTTKFHAFIARPIFNKHVRELRVEHSDKEIMAGMARFAEAVETEAVRLRQHPWFTFYGRRSQFVVHETEVDWFEPQGEPEWDWDV